MVDLAVMTPTFLLSSRLGLLHQPQGQSVPNLGVEEAPLSIVSASIIEELQLQTQEFKYSLPDQVVSSDYYHAFARETNLFRDRIMDSLRVSPEHRPTSIAVGGDHSISLAHIAGLLGTVAIPDKTGIIMIDSHADINLVKTSPTGNLHGMWLRAVMSQFDNQEIDQIVPNKVSPLNVVYVGNQNLDAAERDFIEQQGIQVFPVEYIRENKKAALDWFTNWMKKVSHVHLSIDVDGFDQSLAPATGIPCLNGLMIEDVAEVVAKVKEQRQWSADIVEVNPRKAGGAKTVRFAQDILRTFLTEAW